MCYYLKIPVDFNSASKKEIIELLRESPKFGTSSDCFPSDFISRRLQDMKIPVLSKSLDDIKESSKKEKKNHEVEIKVENEKKPQKEIEKAKEIENNIPGTFISHIRRRWRRVKQKMKSDSTGIVESIFLWTHVIILLTFVVYMIFWGK